MNDARQSGQGAAPSPEQAAAHVERNVGIDGERGELDLERDALRVVIANHLGRVELGVRELRHGVVTHDSHLMIEGLRRLLATGLVGKEHADQLERLLPQSTRLFRPEPTRCVECGGENGNHGLGCPNSSSPM